jgi:hypothetical protein
MPDPNNNPMPEVKSPTVRKVLTWVSWALALGGPSLAAYVAMLSEGEVKTALIIALGLLTALAAALRGGLSNPLKAGVIGAGVMLVALTLGSAGCANTPYKRLATGYNVVNLTKKLGENFDSSVKQFLEAKRTECKAIHATKTAEFDKCVLPAVRLSRAWTGEKNGVKTGKGGLSLLQASQKATKLALNAAFDYVKSNEAACSGDNPPKDCHGDWKVVLKPGFCAAWAVVNAGVKLGAYNATNDPTYKMVSVAIAAFVCGE